MEAVSGGDPERPLILVEDVYRFLPVPRHEEIGLSLPAVVYAQDPLIQVLTVEYPLLDQVFVNDHAGAVRTEMTGRGEHGPWSDLRRVYEMGILPLGPRMTTRTFMDVGNVALAVRMFDVPVVNGNIGSLCEFAIKLFSLVGIECVHVHMYYALAVRSDDRTHGVTLGRRIIRSTFTERSFEKVLHHPCTSLLDVIMYPLAATGKVGAVYRLDEYPPADMAAADYRRFVTPQ